jgi:hypothetical protein
MHTGGDLTVHASVVLEANTAGSYGGAESLPFDISSHAPAVVFHHTFCKSWYDMYSFRLGDSPFSPLN